MFFFTLQKTNICRTFGTFDAYVKNIWSDVVQHTFCLLSRDMSKHVVTWYVKTSQGVSAMADSGNKSGCAQRNRGTGFNRVGCAQRIEGTGFNGVGQIAGTKKAATRRPPLCYRTTWVWCEWVRFGYSLPVQQCCRWTAPCLQAVWVALIASHVPSFQRMPWPRCRPPRPMPSQV